MSSTLRVAAPHGTGGWQTTTARPARARSAKERTACGLSGAVTITSVLLANGTGSPSSRPASATLSIWAVLAEAKTSAPAPSVSWVARSEDPAKLNSTPTPG